LINYADNEGYIGPKVACKLAMDFAEFSAEVIADQDPYFCELYAKWWEACKLAAQNGAIEFH
jgi:hypothetical protein